MTTGNDGLSQREVDRLIEIAQAQQAREYAAMEERWKAHLASHVEHNAIHAAEHRRDAEVTRLREEGLDKAFEAHEKNHESEGEAVRVALANVDRMSSQHTLAHDREHAAHETRHEDQKAAISKADTALDKRLEALNGVYGQMRDLQKTYASQERVEALQKELDRRFADSTKHTDEKAESNRNRIEALEKGNVKQEGKAIGQGAVVAIIISAISLVGTVLGIIIVVLNAFTGG